MEKITKLDLNTDSIKKQANAIYDKLSSMGYDIDVDALMGEAQDFAKLIRRSKTSLPDLVNNKQLEKERQKEIIWK